MHISSADKKEKPWFLKALKTRRNPFFDKTVRKTGFIHRPQAARSAQQTALHQEEKTRICVSFLLVIAKHYRYHTITSAYSSYRHIKRLYFPNFIAAKQKTV